MLVPTEDQVLLHLVAWPLYMYCYCSDFKFLKCGKMNSYSGIKKRGAGGRKSKNVSMYVNSWKTSKIRIILNFQKDQGSKNDAKINSRAT